MPVYAYACTVCGHTFDVRQSFTDDALTVCPECSGRLRKVIGSVGITFKGSGFYRTDSAAGRAGKKSQGSSSAGGSSTTSEGSSSTTSSTSGASPDGGSSSGPSTTTAATTTSTAGGPQGGASA